MISISVVLSRRLNEDGKISYGWYDRPAVECLPPYPFVTMNTATAATDQ